MKKLILIITASFLIFFGCSDSITNVVEPVKDQFNKENYIAGDSLNLRVDPSEITLSSDENIANRLIKLPDNILNVKLKLFISKKILGSEGGFLEILDTYLGTNGLVTILTSLSFPEGSFQGSADITINGSDKYALVECGPHMVFDKPVILNSTYAGLNLSFLSNEINKINFSYISDDGNIYPVENEGISVDPILGIITVKNAKINHFSRYGWTR